MLADYSFDAYLAIHDDKAEVFVGLDAMNLLLSFSILSAFAWSLVIFGGV